eukprot:2530462-Rhodomonas_salina.1
MSVQDVRAADAATAHRSVGTVADPHGVSVGRHRKVLQRQDCTASQRQGLELTWTGRESVCWVGAAVRGDEEQAVVCSSQLRVREVCKSGHRDTRDMSAPATAERARAEQNQTAPRCFQRNKTPQPRVTCVFVAAEEQLDAPWTLGK